MSTRPIGTAIPFLCLLWACDSGNFARHPDQIPTKLAFLGEPSATIEGGAVGQVVVTVEDVYGNTVSNARTNVTLAIGTNPSGATLSGTTTVGAVSGVAVFSDRSIDRDRSIREIRLRPRILAGRWATPTRQSRCTPSTPPQES